MNKVTYLVALENASHEAVIRMTYRDSVGINTWSVGMTSATGHNVDRYINNPQSLQYCMNLYVWALENYAAKVNKTFKGFDLTEAQFAAALSFHWNTGNIHTASWVREWKKSNIKEARRLFVKWNKPPEIIKRRKKERDLFFDGVWSNNGTMTEYTRLTKRRSPVWRSAVKINVEKELKAAFVSTKVPIVDHDPQPDVISTVPTLSDKPNLLRQFILFVFSLLNQNKGM